MTNPLDMSYLEIGILFLRMPRNITFGHFLKKKLFMAHYIYFLEYNQTTSLYTLRDFQHPIKYKIRQTDRGRQRRMEIRKHRVKNSIIKNLC